MNFKSIFVLLFMAQFLCVFGYGQQVDVRKIKISDIEIRTKGEVPVDIETAKVYISANVGDTVSSEDIAVDVRKLLDSGLYSFVGTAFADVTSDGVKLVYQLEGRYRLAEEAIFNFKGAKSIREKNLRKAISLPVGSMIDEELVKTAVNKLKKMYIDERYYDVHVEGRLEKDRSNPFFARVIFDVTEGSKQKVNLIQFEGNTVINDGNLRKYSGQHSKWNPVGWFGKKKVSDYDLELVRLDARKQYLDLGYLDVKISSPIKTKKGNEWDIKFDVVEGVIYHVGNVKVNGVSLFPVESILQNIPLKSGRVAGLSYIDSARMWLRDFFTSKGYIDTGVNYALVPDVNRPGIIDVVFNVKEGELVQVRNIVIRGNTLTLDKVLRREITLNPGDTYNGVRADQSERRLRSTGYFSEVRHFSAQTGDKGTRDLIYEVKEKETGSMMVGIGFSSVDHLIGFFEISQSNFDLFNLRNFKGAGQKARLSLQVSSDSTDVELNFTEPWFMDRRLQFDSEFYIRNRDYSEYDESRTGVGFGFVKHVNWVGRVGLRYNIEQIKLDDVYEGEFYKVDSPTEIYRYTDENDSYLLGSLRLDWVVDTRNNYMIPTKGSRSVFNASLFNTALGSEYDMYELDYRFRDYNLLPWGHVLSFYARASVIDTFSSDEEVPVSKRYFLGGGRYVRGYKYRDIGPKIAPKEYTGGKAFRPLGGQTMLQASIEYTIPLGSVARFATFYDIGNVWEDPFDFDFGEFCSSVGCGIRLDVSGFPIRLDYAWSLEKDDDNTRESRIVFWMGVDN